MSTLSFNSWTNLDGSENYKCRAWVNFNGVGTVAIRAAGNVSSITDLGTGDYQVNFTTPMVDVNYCHLAGAVINGGAVNLPYQPATAKTVNNMRFLCYQIATGSADVDAVNLAFFR